MKDGFVVANTFFRCPSPAGIPGAGCAVAGTRDCAPISEGMPLLCLAEIYEFLDAEGFRFIKQSYNLEDIRVLAYERLRYMAVLVNALAFLTAVVLGTGIKLDILASHLLRAAKRLFALAAGIRDVCARDIAQEIKTFRQFPALAHPLLQLQFLGNVLVLGGLTRRTNHFIVLCMFLLVQSGEI